MKSADVLVLAKPRIVSLALVMAALGFVLGSPKGDVNWTRFVWMILGMGLVGVASGSLNQYLEIEVDSKMLRTRNRPLPTSRISGKFALVLGLLAGLIGEIVLMVFINPLTGILGGITILFYLGIYTPSKLYSPASTLIGAVPGALPPLMGWTAASGGFGGFSSIGMLLFAILFLWQIPHFLAIAWIYREDYARASMPILSVVDNQGTMMAKQIIVYSLALLPLTLVPAISGGTGSVYFWAAMALGTLLLAFGVLLAWFRTVAWARVLFFYSILYLPLLGSVLVYDRKW